jgi:Domain of unknown function (DUF4281)
MVALFALASTFVLPFWLAMILAPTWRWTTRVMRSPLPVAALAAVYAGLVLPRLAVLLPVLAQPNLQPIASLLATPDGATIAWIHFLAFDLFVGRWAYLDSRARGLSPWPMAPVLALTLLFGPLGYLAFLGVRAVHARQLQARLDPRPTLAYLARINRPLTVVGVVMAITLLGTLVGLAVDPRVITGAPAWLKPAKFAISTSIYAFTFVWLLGFVRGHPRLVAFSANTVAAGLAIEVAIIIVQVIRGTTSHFNLATPLDTVLFSTMGAIIVLVWLMSVLAAGLLIAQRLDDPALAWSLRLGLLIALVGMAVAFFMPQPTPAQLAALSAGAARTVIGAHSVGVADGGPGLPIVGWSVLGGDLRVPHFFGLHGLQVLPLFGWLLMVRVPRLDARHRLMLVWIVGLAYLGLVAVLTWQALRGQSVIAPDGATLAAFATLLGLSVLATASVLVHAGQSTSARRPRLAARSVVGSP